MVGRLEYTLPLPCEQTALIRAFANRMHCKGSGFFPYMQIKRELFFNSPHFFLITLWVSRVCMWYHICQRKICKIVDYLNV